MRSKLTILILLTAGILLGLPGQSSAQKRKKNKKVLSQEEAVRRSAFYLTEGEKYYIIEDFTKAVGEFQKSLKYDPNNDVAFYKLAQIYQKTEQAEKAKQNINNAISLNPNNKYYYLLGVDIYTNEGDLQSTAKMYEDMISTLPGETRYLFDLAAIYMYQSKLDEALETYNKTEEIYGVNEKSSVQKQKLYLKKNNVEMAIAEGIKLIKAFPGNANYVFRLSDLYSANGRVDDAIEILNDLIQDQPETSAARLILADIYWKKKNVDAFYKELLAAFNDPSLNINAKISVLMKHMALLPNSQLIDIIPRLSDTLITVHPLDPNSYLIRGDIYTTLLERGLIGKDPTSRAVASSKAISSYSNYVTYDQSKFAVWQNLLNLELQSDGADSLSSHAKLALELFPNQAWLYLVNGVVKLQEKDTLEAVDFFELGKKRASDNIGLLSLFYGYLGDTYNALDQFDNSDDAYESALELNPNNYIILNNYSYYLSLRLEKLELAKKMSIKLIQNNPDNNTYLDTYAWVQYALGDYLEAKRIFEKIIKTGDSNAEYFNHYGDVLYKIGDIDNAVVNWKKAQALDKTLKNIDKKISLRKVVQ